MASMPSKTISEDSKDALPGAPAFEPSLTFEQALGRLEEIVHLLEEGKIGLDDALAQYEEGIGLLRKAYELLERAQRRISLLSGVDSEGNPVLRPMEDTASHSLEVDVVVKEPAAGGDAKSGSRRGRRQMESG